MLRPLSPAQLPPPFAVRKAGAIDLEWYPENYRLRVCGVTLLDGRELEFFSIEDFLNWFLRPCNSGLELWAHYGGRADFAFLIPALVSRGMPTTGIVIGSSVAALTITSGRHKFFLRDSFHLFLCGLDAAGRTFAKRGKTECAFDAPIAELIDYNRNDRSLLLDSLLSLDELWGRLGTHIGLTNASTGFSLMRSRYLKEEIPTNDSTNDVFRRHAFFASRVEPFVRSLKATGEPRGVGWDQNSAHPASYSQAMPGREVWGQRARPKEGLWFLDATIRVPEDLNIAPLPYRREDGRICHPVGSWRGLFCKEEIELLEDSGGSVVKEHWYYRFNETRCLEAYGQDLFARKAKATAEGDVGLVTVLKYALNGGGFGKTAERPERMELVIGEPPDRLFFNKDGSPNAAAVNFRIIAPNIGMLPSFKRAPHEHVPMAALTGARTRCRLTRDMQVYEALGSVILYCDTDGFKGTMISIPPPFATGDGLGAYKLEYKAIDDAYFAGAKLYCLKDTASEQTIVRAKGFPCRLYGEKDEKGKRRGYLPASDDERADIEVMTYEKLRAIALSGGYEEEDIVPTSPVDLRVHYERMRRIPETLASYRRTGSLLPGPLEIKKEARGPRPSRCFGTDGLSRPWHISEL